VAAPDDTPSATAGVAMPLSNISLLFFLFICARKKRADRQDGPSDLAGELMDWIEPVLTVRFTLLRSRM
jgi:hypothetical protein